MGHHLAFKKFQILEYLGFQMSRLGVVNSYLFNDYNPGIKQQDPRALIPILGEENAACPETVRVCPRDKTKDPLKGHMKTQSSRSFLKYLHKHKKYKESLNNWESLMPNLASPITKWNLQFQVWVTSNGVVGQRSPWKPPNRPVYWLLSTD